QIEADVATLAARGGSDEGIVVVAQELIAAVDRQLSRVLGAKHVQLEHGEGTETLSIVAIVAVRARLRTDDEMAEVDTGASPRPVGVEGRGVVAFEREVVLRTMKAEVAADAEAHLVAADRIEGIVRREVVIVVVGADVE